MSNFSPQALTQLYIAKNLNFIFHLNQSEPFELEINGSDFDSQNETDKVVFLWHFFKCIRIKTLTFKYVNFNKKCLILLKSIFKTNQNSIEKISFDSCFFYLPLNRDIGFPQTITDISIIDCIINKENLMFIFSKLQHQLKKIVLVRIRWKNSKVPILMNFAELEDLHIERMGINNGDLNAFILPKLKKLVLIGNNIEAKILPSLLFANLEELYFPFKRHGYGDYSKILCKLPLQLKILSGLYLKYWTDLDELYEIFFSTNIKFHCNEYYDHCILHNSDNFKFLYCMSHFSYSLPFSNNRFSESLLRFLTSNQNNFEHITSAEFSLLICDNNIKILFQILDNLPNIKSLDILINCEYLSLSEDKTFTSDLMDQYHTHFLAKKVESLFLFAFQVLNNDIIEVICHFLSIFRNISSLKLAFKRTEPSCIRNLTNRLNSLAIQFPKLK